MRSTRLSKQISGHPVKFNQYLAEEGANDVTDIGAGALPVVSLEIVVGGVNVAVDLDTMHDEGLPGVVDDGEAARFEELSNLLNLALNGPAVSKGVVDGVAALAGSGDEAAGIIADEVVVGLDKVVNKVNGIRNALLNGRDEGRADALDNTEDELEDFMAGYPELGKLLGSETAVGLGGGSKSELIHRDGYCNSNNQSKSNKCELHAIFFCGVNDELNRESNQDSR